MTSNLKTEARRLLEDLTAAQLAAFVEAGIAAVVATLKENDRCLTAT